MTTAQVENLAQMLPATDPYFRRAFGTRPWEEPPFEWERIDKALLDPAFGWNVATSYTAAGITAGAKALTVTPPENQPG